MKKKTKSICNSCKRKLFGNCTPISDLRSIDCANYEKIVTNRDVLEKMILELSDDELGDIISWKVDSRIGTFLKGHTGKDFNKWLSKPYLVEEKYILYRLTDSIVCVDNDCNTYTNIIYYAGKGISNDIKKAQKFTLKDANKKRNELNDDNPTDNWCVEASNGK